MELIYFFKCNLFKFSFIECHSSLLCVYIHTYVGMYIPAHIYKYLHTCF